MSFSCEEQRETSPRTLSGHGGVEKLAGNPG